MQQHQSFKIDITEVRWDGSDRIPTISEAALLKTVRHAVEQKINAYVQEGSPPEDYHKRLEYFAKELCMKADILLCPTPNSLGVAYKILDGLADAIAILAFVPQGVSLFDVHYEVTKNGDGKT